MKPGNISAPNRWKLRAWTTISITLLALSVTPAFIDVINVSAKYLFRITKGSLVYGLLQNEMPGAYVKAYIFNVTNSERFLAGLDQNLKVEEIGPFTYQEYRKHDDFFLDEDEHTLHYIPLIKPRFVRNLSVADPKDITVTVPNIPMLAMASTMGGYPFWSQMGFNMLVNRVDAQPIITLSAQDFMWGYKEPLIALGNTLLPGWINFEKLGVLDRLYDQKVRDTIVVGATNTDKFRIKTVNGEGGIRHRGYDPSKRDHCNTFEDTYEGLAYPPDLTPETKLRLYRNVFCRIMDLQYVGSKDMEFGPKGFIYRLSNSTFRKSAENQCLCGNICIDGMTDLSTCFYGFGVSFSQAHFLDVDPKFYERIDGMKPDFDKHGSEFLINPDLGSVMDTRITLQLNVVMENADFNARTKPLSNMIIPVLYFKIVQPELPEEVKSAFRNLFIVYPQIVIAIQVALLLIALALLAYAWRLVKVAWICKKALGFQANTDKPAQVYEEPLMEENVFVAEIVSNKQFADKNHERA